MPDLDLTPVTIPPEKQKDPFTYTPAGATIDRFHADQVSMVRGAVGPVGSGKSSACCMELFMQMMAHPSQYYDGVARSRWAVVRNTYGELRSTTIQTWLSWFPPNICRMVYDMPIMCYIKFTANLPDGRKVPVESEVYFLSMESEQDNKKLRGLEISGGWMNEARYCLAENLLVMIERSGRYPAKRRGGTDRKIIIMDTNPPDTDSWYYHYAEVERPAGWNFLRQPGGLLKAGAGYIENPLAENIDNLTGGYKYYFDMIAGRPESSISVNILGEYGSDTTGKRVYPEFTDGIHLAKKAIEPYRGIDLVGGMDFGLDTCCVIGQASPRGQYRILDEIVGEHIGTRRFAREMLRPFLNAKYPGMKIRLFGDPAGSQENQSDESTCFMELQQEGFECEPAGENNNPEVRHDAVLKQLILMVDGMPAFLLSPACEVIRQGFLSKYCYEKHMTAKYGQYKTVPTKNKWSHIMNALEYLMMGMGGRSSRPRHVYVPPNVSSAGYA